MDLSIDQPSGSIKLHRKGSLLPHCQTHLLKEEPRRGLQSRPCGCRCPLYEDDRRCEKRSNLQAADGEAAGVVGQCGDGNEERRVWDVIVIELDGNFIVAWRGKKKRALQNDAMQETLLVQGRTVLPIQEMVL